MHVRVHKRTSAALTSQELFAKQFLNMIQQIFSLSDKYMPMSAPVSREIVQQDLDIEWSNAYGGGFPLLFFGNFNNNIMRSLNH